MNIPETEMRREKEIEGKARKIEIIDQCRKANMMLMVGVVTIDLGRVKVVMATDLADQMHLGEVRASVGTAVAEASMMTSMIGTEIDLEKALAKVLVNQGTISMGKK